MSWWKRFISDPLITSLSQVPWFGFVLTAILVAAMVNLATSIIIEWVGAGWAFALLRGRDHPHASVCQPLCLPLETTNRRRRTSHQQDFTSATRRFDCYGHQSAYVARKAVELSPPVLKHLWLIETPEIR